MSCDRCPRCPATGHWREGRDSNPRGNSTPPTRLAGGRFRPLSHLPAKGLPDSTQGATQVPLTLRKGSRIAKAATAPAAHEAQVKLAPPDSAAIIRRMQAPGGPGAPPAWGPGCKQGFGTAAGPESRVWYTIADGSLSDVFHP